MPISHVMGKGLLQKALIFPSFRLLTRAYVENIWKLYKSWFVGTNIPQPLEKSAFDVRVCILIHLESHNFSLQPLDNKSKWQKDIRMTRGDIMEDRTKFGWASNLSSHTRSMTRKYIPCHSAELKSDCYKVFRNSVKYSDTQ